MRVWRCGQTKQSFPVQGLIGELVETTLRSYCLWGSTALGLGVGLGPFLGSRACSQEEELDTERGE